VTHYTTCNQIYY